MAAIVRSKRRNRNYLVHNLNFRRVSWAYPYSAKEFVPGSDELSRIALYIKNPTHEGIWKLGVNLLKKSEVVADIRSLLGSENKKDMSVRRYGFDRLSHLPEIPLLLAFLKLLVENEKKKSRKAVDYYDFEFSEFYKKIESGNHKQSFENFKNKYSALIKFFESNLFLKEMSTNIASDAALIIKGGSYFFEYEDEDERPVGGVPYECVFASVNKELLIRLKTFLELSKITSSVKFVHIFSPEGEVFASYINLLNYSYKYLFLDDSVSGVIDKAISEYEDEKHDTAVSKVGMGAEEILVEIYENYFRQPAPQKYALKQIYTLIHVNLRDYLRPSMSYPETKGIDSEIGELAAKKEGDISKKNLIMIMQHGFKITKDLGKYFETKVKRLENSDFQDSVFPRWLRNNIEELIENRNKASHKSRISADNYEAMRTIYCYITLVMWWREDKEKIDPDQDQGEIIMESVSRNSAHTQELPSLQAE